MAAYLIIDAVTTDPDALARYKAIAGPVVERFGGRYLVRGGTVEPMEGDWDPERIVVVAFPTMDAARAFYRSPDYAEALTVSKGAQRRRMILVDGVRTG